jgi:hypothetical protein
VLCDVVLVVVVDLKFESSIGLCAV